MIVKMFFHLQIGCHVKYIHHVDLSIYSFNMYVCHFFEWLNQLLYNFSDT